MKVIFLNRFFYPDISATSQMLSDQAFALADAGYTVVVIAARQSYANTTQSLSPQEQLKGVTVHRVWTSSFGRSRLVGRGIDYASFFVTAAFQLIRLMRAGDIVVTKTDPPLLSIVTTALCRLRGAKSVNWLQDIFPEVAERLGVAQTPLAGASFRLLRRLRDRSLRRAHKNVVLGPVMQRYVERLGVPPAHIVQIPNWADGRAIRPVPKADNALRTSWALQDDFVVCHSGNLGRAHDSQAFLTAIEALEYTTPADGSLVAEAARSEPASTRADGAQGRSAPQVRWLFIGGGIEFDALKQTVSARGLQSVMFKPYQPRENLGQSLSCADVHLVTLRPELEGLIVPSKVYGCLAAGRPILFVGAPDGEIAQLIAQHACGWVVQPDDPVGLTSLLRSLARHPGEVAERGRNARRAFERDFDVRHAHRRWRELIAELEETATNRPAR